MKKSVKRILMSLIVIVGLVVSVGLGFFANVQAASGYVSDGEASALIECYNNGAFKSPVQGKVFKDSYAVGAEKFMTTHQVYIPIGSTGLFKTDPAKTKATCPELVNKLLKDRSISVPGPGSTGEEITTFMEGLGYTNVFDTTKKIRCFQFKYTVNVSGIGNYNGVPQLTKSICAEIEGGSEENGYNDGVMVGTLSVQNNGNTYLDQLFDPIVVLNGNLEIRYLNEGILFQSPKLTRSYSYEANNTKWGEFKEKIKDDVLTLDLGNERSPAKGSFKRYPGDITVEYDIVLNNGSVDIANGDLKNVETAANYKIDSNSVEAKHAGTTILVGQRLDTKPQFTDDEIASLYSAYLKNFYGAETKFELSEDEVKKGKYVETKSCKDGEMKKAYTRATKNKEELVGGVDNNDIFGIGVKFDQIAKWLKDYDEEECPEESNPEPGSNPDDPNKSKDIVDCNQLKTIGAMQWVLCPTMNNMQYTTSWIDNMTQDWLQVDTKLYSGPQVTEVWGYIRNVANVLMIIFLLVVIFSQLTGRGIDNYGIKKMLPRLIMMALIINLSMYICQLAVDLSNIAGSGLRDMFGAFGLEASGTEKPGDPSFLTGMIMGMFAAADTGGAVGFGTLATLTTLGAPTAVAIVIAVIVLLLAILVAVVVLFLMLGAREIIVIVCVVISPLAFAAYVLPNTQNLFKKWWELFKAALIIFPICGAIGGISSMLRKMAETGPDLHIWGFAILMILPYLGFFLIPMLLKNAIAALGKIGGALTAMGNKVKSGGQIIGKNAMNAAKNTEKYKQLSAEAAKKKQAKMSQKTIDKLEALKKEREARGEKLSDRDAQRLYDAQQTQTKLRYEQEMANIGAVVPSSEQIYARATSAKDTQEMKLIMDSYAGFGRTRMANELTDAYTSYLNNRSESNGLRLRAALSKADSMGMDKELLNVLNGTDAATGQTALLNSGGAPLSQLGFRSEVDGKETEDAKIATTLAGLNNKVANRFGKQLGKAPEDELSLNQFATNMGAGGLREAISGKGPDYLNGVDEDTVGFLAKASEQAGGNVVDTETLLHAAASTTDTKVNNNLAGMIANADSSKPSGLTGKILVAQRGNALSAITNQVKNAGYGSEIHKEFMKATTDIANNPELLSTLTKEQAKMFNEVRGDKLFKVD